MNVPGLEYLPGLPTRPADEGILTAEAVAFLGELVVRFGPRVEQLLRAREQRQARLDAGEMPDFYRRPVRSAKATGGSGRFRPTCRTAASRSRDRPIAR